MKIIHLISELKKGGAERLCLDICNELTNKKANFLIIIFNNLNTYNELTENLRINVINIKLKLSVFNKNKIDLDELNKFVNNFNPDIIHSHLFFAELVSQVINSNAVRICHVHDDIKQLNNLNLTTFFSKQSITNYYEKLFYLKNYKLNKTVFLCISKDSMRIILKKIPNANCILFPNGINTSNFKPIKRKLSSKINLISIGSFVPKKGHELLLETMFNLKKMSKIEFNLHLLGDGILKEKLIKKAAKLNILEDVKFHGIVSETEKYLHGSDIYVHSAKYEPFGLVIVEAMSTGLPVISTDGKGNSDIFNGNNGILLSHRDPKKYALEILELVINKTKYFQLSGNSIKTAKKYNITTYTEKLLKLYLTSTI